MNSRSILTAVLVAVSFFALCFVCEMRSALPEVEGKEIAVGAYNTFGISIFLPDACPPTPEISYETSYSYQTIHFDCGCEQTFPLNSGCVSPYSESACTAKNGHLTLPSEYGIYVDDTKSGNCGEKTGYYCETAYPGQKITLTHDFNSECPHGSCSLEKTVYPCHRTNNRVPNLDCGTKKEVKKGC